MNQARWITLAFFLGAAGGGISAGTLASAAVGDAIYEAPTERVEIGAGQAVCFADCAIAAGAWSGARADMIKTCAFRDPNSETGFTAFTRGMKAAALADVPIGSTVHGVVE